MRPAYLYLLAVAIFIPEGVAAQPLVRADAAGVIAWLNANKSDISSYNDWYNSSLYAGATFGWYWTDHLKTEVEAAISSPAELYSSEQEVVDGRPTYVNARREFRTRRITASQHYQFLRNAWAHPYVAAGLDVTWERIERTEQRYLPFPEPSSPRETTFPATTELRTRPFAEIGAKLYVSRRAFVRTDLRMVLHSGVDEVLLRFGFGVDF